MAGVTNKTERQYNLKTIGKNGNRVTVRLVPGFNVVDDKHWVEFVSKEGKVLNAYVSELNQKGKLDFGKGEDDKELESEAPKSKSKSQAMPKAKK
jgi:uncharacterized protein (DUF2252 family)